MDNEYYILEKGERIGPFSPRELMNRPLEPGDMVLSSAQMQAVPAHTLPEFEQYFKSEGIYFPTKRNTSNYILRLPAFIIDYFILAIGSAIVFGVLFSNYIHNLYPDMTTGKFDIGKFQDSLLKHQKELFILDITMFFITVIYNAACESGRLKGSVGKYVMGLAVVDNLGYSLTFGQALKRNLGKFVYYIIGFALRPFDFLAYLAYLRMVFSDRHQAFHDMFSGCYVVKKDI